MTKLFLSEINIYPVKSLGGITVGEARVERRGLAGDRRYVLVDGKNRFLSQREHPKLATFSVEHDGGRIAIAYRGESVSVGPETAPAGREPVSVWDDVCEAEVFGAEISEWFSQRLGFECRLARMPEETRRIVDQRYALASDDHVSFADAYPFLLIGAESLRDLNSRLAVPVSMNRFRPNLVVNGADAFAEDGWSRIRIGGTVFRAVKPCSRCVMTTVDQETGEKHSNEPLRTLAGYRTVNGKVLFGQNLIVENPGGTIRVGDEVEVLDGAPASLPAS